ncbi:MAG TPA: extracellular solute-binding protein [Chloroflexia bacterium]|nr:extracellular solute-binding protein [Chloroflexia bacterium]
MYRKVLVVLLLALAFPLGLAACGTTPAAPPANTPQAGNTPATSGDAGEATPTVVVPPSKGDKAAISAWTQANSVETTRATNIEEAATKLGFKAEAIADPTGWGDYKKKFLLAADSGQGPDIILSGHEDIAPWGQAGYIIPLDEMIDANKAVYDDIIPSLWESVTWDGKRWGIPQDTEARPMYYNKKKLVELGWTEAEAEGLQDRITSGDFTLDDMIALSKEAIEKGVIKEGDGYWHRPTKGGDFYQYYFAYGGELSDEATGKLLFDKKAAEQWFSFQRRVIEEGITPKTILGTESKIWHEKVTSGDVLFWNAGVWSWADWAKNYVKDKGGDDYLYGFVGWALQPSGIKGQPGVTLSHPLVYMVSSEKASGETQQKEAFDVITGATTPELNNKHAIGSTHLAILKAQVEDPEYAANKLLAGTAYMLDHTRFLPNNPNFGPYDDIVFRLMSAAENGEMSPADAVNAAADELQTELGDKVVIR